MMKNNNFFATVGLQDLCKVVLLFLLFIIFLGVDASTFKMLYNVITSGKSQWLPTAHMLACSNIRQGIVTESSKNILITKPDVTGWSICLAKDKRFPAVLSVNITYDRPYAICYPRIEGKNSFIRIYETSGAFRSLAKITSYKQGWSDIGQQYRLDLDLLEHAPQDSEFGANLSFVLFGPDSQLWIKDGNVFF